MPVTTYTLTESTTSTPVFYVKDNGRLLIAATGTFDGATLTIQVSYDGTNFVTYTADGLAQTLTTIDHKGYWVIEGAYFRFSLGADTTNTASVTVRATLVEAVTKNDV